MIDIDIRKNFGNFKLDVKFKSEGEILGLLGPSGSGKSLTLKCLAGIEKPDFGKIVLNDRVLFDSEKNINMKVQDRKIGYLFQDYALFPNMTVLENMRVGMPRNLKKEDQDLQLKKILEELELLKLQDKLPSKLSGGEKQRVALGRILVTKPEILFLDEPFSALDDYLKLKIEIGLKEIIAKYQLPAIFVSHSRDEVYRFCKSIVIMEKGRSEERQETKELFSNPQTLSAALISGCKNFSYIERISSDEIYSINWGTKLRVREDKEGNMIGVRAHFIEIGQERDENSFEVNLVHHFEDVFSSLIIVEPLSSRGRYKNLMINMEKDKWKSLSQLNKYYVTIKPEHIMVLKEKEINERI